MARRHSVLRLRGRVAAEFTSAACFGGAAVLAFGYLVYRNSWRGILVGVVLIPLLSLVGLWPRGIGQLDSAPPAPAGGVLVSPARLVPRLLFAVLAFAALIKVDRDLDAEFLFLLMGVMGGISALSGWRLRRKQRPGEMFVEEPTFASRTTYRYHVAADG